MPSLLEALSLESTLERRELLPRSPASDGDETDRPRDSSGCDLAFGRGASGFPASQGRGGAEHQKDHLIPGRRFDAGAYQQQEYSPRNELGGPADSQGQPRGMPPANASLPWPEMCKEGMTIELPLVLTPTTLCNARLGFPSNQRGRRRWYKEFRAFAQSARLSSPSMPHVVRDGVEACFCNIDLRDLAPLVLQAVANGSRERYSRNLPQWFRTFEGCEHAIVRRTGAPLPIVHEFVNQFCAVNEDVLALIDRAVQREPHRNFFD